MKNPIPLGAYQTTGAEGSHWPLTRLRHLHLEMGQQCNARCSMCYQTDFSPATRLPDVVWRERLKPAYEHIRSITMQGGEPTVIMACRDLLTMIRRNYPDVTLDTVTNGILWKGIWEEAFLAQGSCVNFSLNAVDPQLYHRIVQFGRYDDVVSNIRRMVRRKQECQAKVIIRISTVMMPETIAELPVFVQWAVDNGLDQALVHTDTVRSAKLPEVSFVQNQIAQAYAIADRNPQMKLLHLDEFDAFYARVHRKPPVRSASGSKLEARPCPIAFDNLFVSYQGLARVCCKSWYLLGNLVDQTLEEVWNGAPARRFRKRMLRMDFRDCMVACDLNANPIDPRVAQIRKAYWVFRRDPKAAFEKAMRRLHGGNVQLDVPGPE